MPDLLFFLEEYLLRKIRYHLTYLLTSGKIFLRCL